MTAITSYWSSIQDTAEEHNKAAQPTESGMSSEDVLLNPNAFTEFKLAGSDEVSLKCLTLNSHFLYFVIHIGTSRLLLMVLFLIYQEIAADEAGVRKAGKYLLDVVLPKFVQDLCTLEVSPMDGQTLTEALHAQGINVRYIGKVSIS